MIANLGIKSASKNLFKIVFMHCFGLLWAKNVIKRRQDNPDADIVLPRIPMFESGTIPASLDAGGNNQKSLSQSL